MKKALILILALMLSSAVYAEDGLRTRFLNDGCVICGINIRNFNSKDSNHNGFIDENEEKGTFLNAIDRLDELKELGINTVHLLPITPAGKLKALGTSGSLYAINDFGTINPQIIDKKSNLSDMEQAKLFIDECHKRGIKVIIDLPSCGSYDLFLKRPELFLKDDKQLSIVPTDWTDVRLFKTGDNEKLNEDLYNEHIKFVNMVLDMNADGIRADVATIKPYKFWENLIRYTRERNSEFLFLAEAYTNDREAPSKYAIFTPYEKLLEVGFDGYYGSFNGLKDWDSASDLIEHVKFNKKMLSSFKENKSAILSFTTHDEVSPILLHGENFSKMICWLEATLPFNPYIIDGFYTGDDYLYPKANERAPYTETDDDYYFVHRGKLDIFNPSRKPEGKYENIRENYKNAVKFRSTYKDTVTNGAFIPLSTKFSDVFAYSRLCQDCEIIVVGNLNFEKGYKKIKIKTSAAKKGKELKVFAGENNWRLKGKTLYTDVSAGEIKVLLIKNFSI